MQPSNASLDLTLIPHFPDDILYHITAFLHKEDPAQCHIEEWRDAQQARISYRITRNGKLKFSYDLSETNLNSTQLHGVKPFLEYDPDTSGWAIFYIGDAQGHTTFSLGLAHSHPDVIKLTSMSGSSLPDPGTYFTYKFFKRAFDIMIRDIQYRLTQFAPREVSDNEDY